ncbi:MAG: SDR family oxidoreductase [Chloroflexi bacterium]|nr:SDR family oxidoreductase [Chloroflexota bacterium]
MTHPRPHLHRHALVTGASSGMGRAIALLLPRRGYHVFASVRRASDADALRVAANGELTPLLMDVTSSDQIAQARATVRDHVGQRGLDALVNNAGIGVAWPLELVPLDTFRSQFEINVDGQLAVTQACLPLLRQAEGRVIMIGSIADRMTPPFVGPLAATKHALLGLSESLRQELAPWRIRVVLIEPGNIRTEAGGKFARDAEAALERFGPAGQALYADAFRSMTTRFAARHEHGSDPSVVAEVVLKAIEARRPRARYLVGKDALRFALLANLPPFALDALRRRIFGLPPSRPPARRCIPA